MSAKENRKPWPQDCCWPEPYDEAPFWEAEDAEGMALDDAAEELLEIREYMDGLVSEGILNEDYSLREDDGGRSGTCEAESEWMPEKGAEYWDGGFELESWEEDLTEHLNLLKLPLPSPVEEIRQIIGYEFINENMLRQAFTRRAFAMEYGTGDSEVLEFIGDTVLNTVVTREMARQAVYMDIGAPRKPFVSGFNEGELSRIKQHFVSQDYLSERAESLGLDRYILYGSMEEASASAREDMMEALIGAVATDSNWNWYAIEAVVDRLICFQMSNPESFAKPTYYELFNAWHQKKFGRMPEYEVSKGTPVSRNMNSLDSCEYYCTLRFFVPENDRGIWRDQRVDVRKETRSKAREYAAKKAYEFVVGSGLWMNLSDAGIVPELENAINQLQELYQKKYVDPPQYSFEEDPVGWSCDCSCSGVEGWGCGISKTVAKKKAAYMVLKKLMQSAGL